MRSNGEVSSDHLEIGTSGNTPPATRITLLETNLSPPKSLLKMIFLFPNVGYVSSLKGTLKTSFLDIFGGFLCSLLSLHIARGCFQTHRYIARLAVRTARVSGETCHWIKSWRIGGLGYT